jgi:hypothetical protein
MISICQKDRDDPFSQKTKSDWVNTHKKNPKKGQERHQDLPFFDKTEPNKPLSEWVPGKDRRKDIRCQSPEKLKKRLKNT